MWLVDLRELPPATPWNGDDNPVIQKVSVILQCHWVDDITLVNLPARRRTEGDARVPSKLSLLR
ncbi:hypothetical protein BDZ97DRAFT_1815346 [Flammula alnicola]|nr:hypothetical protein BDZ97DRAFT_1815346 [Flammula alnicola]